MLVKGGLDKLKRKNSDPGRAVFSKGNQGILVPNVSNGKDSLPGKGVGEGRSVAVGSGMDVAGMGVDAGAQALNKLVNNTNVRKTDPIDSFITLISFWFDCAGLRLTRIR
jgi:hypothetical protein